MPQIYLPDLRLHYREQGSAAGPAVVFAHALGTDLTLWDAVLPLLPPGLRLITLDMRGHGGSDTPAPPYAMGALIRDAERALDHLGVRDSVFLGLSIGGMIAQGLAVKRLDMIRALVLSNTATKIATPATWAARIAAVQAGGMAAVADQTMERWFPPAFRGTPAFPPIRARFLAQRPDGWLGCAAAIAGADFYATTAQLTLPTLCLAGSADGSSPPDLVRETADLIRGSRFHLLRGAGHLPPLDQPQAFAAALSGFLGDIGHARAPKGR
jgi:3-oxoadipate enol-lactonase